jgi:hypothetical protein
MPSEELSPSLNKYYENWFAKQKEHESLDPAQWKVVHLIGYFAKKYQNQYKVAYQFKLDKPQPSKCFESFTIQRLGASISVKPEMIKAYIDWIFAEKVVNSKRRLTSISFLIAEDLMSQFKQKHLLTPKNEKIERSTPLPANIQAMCKLQGYPASTFGELSFIYAARKDDEGCAALVEKLVNIGFDVGRLEKV